MRLSTVAFLMILTTVFLSGCASSQSAAVDDRGQNFYGRSGGSAIASFAPVQAAPTMMVQSQDLSAPLSNAPAASLPVQAASRWQWPVEGKVTESFGPKANGEASEGIVIAAAENTPIRAAQSGEVAFVGEDAKNYGNIVILRHPDGTMASYSHASRIVVKKGDAVRAGNTIAYVGKTGNAASPQLHFAVREGKNSVDPLSKLPHQLASH
jgi:murein DD-endopeptidase MepM/ murein hydrolase activator NlpD